jgi:cation transport ATPase
MTEREHQSVCQHILGTSANLLGICFAIFTVIRALGFGESTYIDELAIVAVFLFLGSCLFSYTSMRSRKRWILYEKIADVIFITALAFMSILTLVLATGVIK